MIPGLETKDRQAVERWASVGPYYAMFPTSFAFRTIRKYSKPGQAVLDPFSGRGSSVYAAALQDRTGLGFEINPVGWLYANTKLSPARKKAVLDRLTEIGGRALKRKSSRKKMPEFYSHCFTPQVLAFLLEARESLNWKDWSADRTLMAFILIYLHGKENQALSNQMRQSKAMSPNYSVGWWKKKKSKAPDIDPVEFLKTRIEWRYLKGLPEVGSGKVHLGNCIQHLNRMVSQRDKSKFDLLLTSPPYIGVTNYHYDQWLRLWMLGGPTLPQPTTGDWRGKFSSRQRYKELLEEVFDLSARFLTRNAVIYVRTDARKETFELTYEVLRKAFSKKRIHTTNRPFRVATQTALFGDVERKPGEIDIILT